MNDDLSKAVILRDTDIDIDDHRRPLEHDLTGR